MKPFLLEPIPDYTIWGTNHISKARGIDEDYGPIKLSELIKH